jgi:hypothetical protein
MSATVVRGPWKEPKPPRPPLPIRSKRDGGYWEWHEMKPCEDIEGFDPGELVHIPCEVCGPYCDGPDCLCRESAIEPPSEGEA